MFIALREKIINISRDYSILISEAKYKGTYREGLEILNPNQMLQRLSIALVQAKPSNTSKNLLDEVKQFVFFFYREKEITIFYSQLNIEVITDADYVYVERVC